MVMRDNYMKSPQQLCECLDHYRIRTAGKAPELNRPTLTPCELVCNTTDDGVLLVQAQEIDFFQTLIE